MTDTDPNATPATPSASVPPTGSSPNAETKGCCGGGRRFRRRGRFMLIIGTLIAGGVIGGLASKAFSHGHGWRHAGFMGDSGFAGPIDPARMDERIERGVKHFAVEANATAEQTQKLTAIAKSAAADLLPMRDKVQGMRKQVVDLMTQPTIDRAQIEKLRTEQMGNAETLSKRVSQAFADAAEVLTPEQRKVLADRMAERQARWNR